jgi:hypothetical protein
MGWRYFDQGMADALDDAGATQDELLQQFNASLKRHRVRQAMARVPHIVEKLGVPLTRRLAGPALRP